VTRAGSQSHAAMQKSIENCAVQHDRFVITADRPGDLSVKICLP